MFVVQTHKGEKQSIKNTPPASFNSIASWPVFISFLTHTLGPLASLPIRINLKQISDILTVNGDFRL